MADTTYEGKRVQVLDHGYVQLVEHWGSDERIVEAARMSTGKGFLGWKAGPCPTCGGDGQSLHQVVPLIYEKRPCHDCGGKGTIAGDEKLLRHLWAHKHHTPFEMAGMVVEVQAPIFVFREWMRHRTFSFNEMSGRYVPLPDVNYIPTVERLLLNRGTRNQQAAAVKGSSEIDEGTAGWFRHNLEEMYRLQEVLYQQALSNGVPKELARVHLGVGRYSRMRASANLRNWLQFLFLRMADDAQFEIRAFATEAGKMVEYLFPGTWALFQEGWQKGS